jgi:hypothetical protein
MRLYALLGFKLHARANNDAVAIVGNDNNAELDLVYNANAHAGGNEENVLTLNHGVSRERCAASPRRRGP